MVVDIPDVITSANFGEDRLRGLGVAGGQNLPFSIDFDHRPYNTLALPCECVMSATVIVYKGHRRTLLLPAREYLPDHHVHRNYF